MRAGGEVCAAGGSGLRARAKSAGVRQQGRKRINTVGQSEPYNGPHASIKGVQGAGMNGRGQRAGCRVGGA